MASERVVTGDEYFALDGQFAEIRRQLRSRKGYPFDLQGLRFSLQQIIEGRFANIIPRRKVWKTVSTGHYKHADAYRGALTKAGCSIGEEANELLSRTSIAYYERQHDLVIVTSDDLGYSGPQTMGIVWSAALSQGLTLCPAEIGPVLALAYTEQRQDESLILGMEPMLSLSKEGARVFGVRTIAGRELIAYDGARYQGRLAARYVFCQPRR